ncbi:unnamed protein product [Paramecium octaurelia]|uniref:Tetratricopeptide repeat protein n=1 Tax=Paramecium octaurelia TaxID=43137 RepID=A0A8S1T4Y9_PAROT|nr:unnamed protein product [Paramecium octaurelia]
MNDFKCTYIDHEKESILGFCLNQNCNKKTQFCFECLKAQHSNHIIDCIQFTSMSKYIQDSLEVYKESCQQIINIIDQMNICLEKFKKKIDQEIENIKNLNQQLVKNDYPSLNSQIQFIKTIYSKEKEKEIQLQLQQLNKIVLTIETVTKIQTQVNAQINTGRKIKITEINVESGNDNQSQITRGLVSGKNEKLDKDKNFQDLQNMLDNPNRQGIDFYLWKSYGLNNLGRYQESIECCQKAIKLNSQNDKIWNNLGFALNSLGRYQEAIQKFDKAIQIDPKNDMAENNKGFSLNSLQRYKEAIECYDRAIKISPKNHFAHMNKGFALHQLEQFQQALLHYDTALSICDDPHILYLKANLEAKLRSSLSSKPKKNRSFSGIK